MICHLKNGKIAPRSTARRIVAERAPVQPDPRKLRPVVFGSRGRQQGRTVRADFDASM